MFILYVNPGQFQAAASSFSEAAVQATAAGDANAAAAYSKMAAQMDAAYNAAIDAIKKEIARMRKAAELIAA